MSLRRVAIVAAVTLCARCSCGSGVDQHVYVCGSDADCADGWRCAASHVCEQGGGAAGGGQAGGASGGDVAGGGAAGGATAGGATAGGGAAGGSTAGGAVAGGGAAGGATAGGATAGGSSGAIDAGPLPGCLAAWDFDEDGGSVVFDRCGRGHDGTLVNVSRSAGVDDGGLRITGATSRVRVPGSSDFDRGAGAFSITAWVRRVQPLSHGLTLSVNYGATSAMYGLELLSDTELTYWDGVEHKPIVPVRYDGGWHHLAVTHTGSVATLYFDGTKLDAGPTDTTPRTCTDVQLGNSSYGDPLGGDLDKVRFYGRALSDGEVVQDMKR